jgi:TetR/AcrR family transcriptional regulator, regulator of cefoperazone and chloramphenicol sensitivity
LPYPRHISNTSLKTGLGEMTRPSEFTRERILRTAARLFAERGYEATSIRTLAAKARVNQAAINYHFKTKDGLYREVLRDAIHALTEHQLSHAQETQAMPRERALAEFVRRQLRPLSARDDVTRYIHILNWEAVRPTTVYRKLVSEEAAPFMGFAVDLIRRFLPKADQRTSVMAAVWLMGQCHIFIRYREQLASPPVSLDLDDPAVDELSTLISGWALTGLAQANGHGSQS